MRTHFTNAPILIFSIAVVLAFSGPVLAKQKHAKSQLSYTEAWSVCKKFVDDGVKSWDQTSQRYARGGACMKKYGYQI